MKRKILIGICLGINLLMVGCIGDIEGKTASIEVSSVDKNNKEIEVEKSIPNTEEIVEYMCSEEIKDRAGGTEGNLKVTNYLDEIFKNINLEYVFDNTYLQKFKYEDESGEKDISNVVGKISGKDNRKAIVITAHFDAWFNGALDNASGVSSAIKVINELKIYSKDENLNYDVIVCLTNLEMNRRRGSAAFIKEIKNKYDEMYNINIDCIGVKNGEPMAVKNLSKIEKSKKLYDGIKEVYDRNNIEYVNAFSTPKTQKAFEQGMGVSDYFEFEKENIPNMQVAQKGINGYILNENDIPSNLDLEEIDRISEALIELVKKIEFK